MYIKSPPEMKLNGNINYIVISPDEVKVVKHDGQELNYKADKERR